MISLKQISTVPQTFWHIVRGSQYCGGHDIVVTYLPGYIDNRAELKARDEYERTIRASGVRTREKRMAFTLSTEEHPVYGRITIKKYHVTRAHMPNLL